MKRLIIFLIRKRLGVKKFQYFQFKEQNNKNDFYYFKDICLMKLINSKSETLSAVSLNWLLNDDCEIVKWDKFVE